MLPGIRRQCKGEAKKQTKKGGRAGGSLPASRPLSGRGGKGTKSCCPRNLWVSRLHRDPRPSPIAWKVCLSSFPASFSQCWSMNWIPGHSSPKHFWQFPLSAWPRWAFALRPTSAPETLSARRQSHAILELVLPQHTRFPYFKPGSFC